MTDASSSSLPASDSPDFVDRLIREMADSWHQGQCRPAESFLTQHPKLLDHPEEAVRLIYEEVCLRQEGGQEVAADDLFRRFPRWTGELAVLLDCHRLMQTQLVPVPFPGVGETLGDFRLVAELGRGAHGRVYLATQPALADRPVVLKVTRRRTREHLSLARLQHTHIIPLHAMYEFPEKNLRAMCMPYLGGATLARVLDLLRHQPPSQRTGQALVNALDLAQKDAPVRLPGRGGYRQTLAAASYVEAMALLGACLADGLHYAHERGLLYLDLKPTNVLLAADAQPLLLDFHLAVHPLRPGQPAPEWFGGTPGYMSPEQEAACAAAQRGGSVARGVDGRSDIHALGRLLYLALTGEDKIAEGVFPLLHQRNPRVSRGLSDLIHKCLAECPEDRYPNAAAVAADLRRHLAHLPLRGVPNRDLGERWRKWLRRRPAAALWTGLVLALLTGGAMLATVGIERFRDAQIALAEAQGQMQRKAYREAVRTLVRGEARVKELPGSGGLVEIFETHLHQACRAEAAEDLHAVAEVLRFLAGAAIHSTRELKTLDVQCGKIWAVRGLLTDQAHPPLETGTADQVRSDLLDLSLLWTDLKRRLASQGGEAGDGPEEMVRVLAEAERLLGPSPALTREQHRPERTRETHLTPGSDHDRQAPWEHVALGHSLLRSGDLERAAEELDRAVDLRPQDFWANFYRGACAYRLHQYADAVHSFGVAIALVPRSPECYYNRALAHAAWGKKDRARNDYDHALALAPQFGAAALNRGVLYYQEGRWSQARADLEQALRNGAEPATAHYNLALVHLALHDSVEARQHLQQALRHNPAHAEARSLLESLRRQK